MWQGEVLDVLFQKDLHIAIEESKPDGVGEEDWRLSTLLVAIPFDRKRTKVSIHEGNICT